MFAAPDRIIYEDLMRIVVSKASDLTAEQKEWISTLGRSEMAKTSQTSKT